MKKNWVILITLILSLVVFVGCGASVAKEEQVQNDLETFSDKAFLADGETISSLVIDKRDTDKKQKTDRVWCTVTTEKDDISYEKGVVLDYYLYDKAGWMLDNYTVDDSEKWVVRPLKGVDENTITNNLAGQTVTVDGEEWEIMASEITKVSIQNEDTDLEKKTSQVTLTVQLDGEVETVEGTLIADYEFDRAWKLKNLYAKDSLRAEVKDGKALDVSADSILDDIQNPEIKYGVSGAIQKVTISKDEVEDFSVDGQQSKSKGTEQTIQCSAKLIKSNVTFNVAINAEYVYENGAWNCYQIDPVLTFDSAELQGEWKGTYIKGGGNGVAVLEITEVDGNNLKGTYSYTPYKTNKWSQPGSYEVEGEFVPDGLLVTLKAGDWVNEPEKYMSVTKQDISAVLYADDGIMKGSGQESCIFNISKQ
mgnify:FL=1